VVFLGSIQWKVRHSEQTHLRVEGAHEVDSSCLISMNVARKMMTMNVVR
jgi:hypothetical protein